MSKSLGNFFTIREIFEKSKWPEAETGEILRYFLLGTHYRSPLDFSDQGLLEAKNAVNGFYDLFARLKESEDRATADKELMPAIERCDTAFRTAMDDDFNTSVAIAELQRLKSDVNKFLSQGLSTEARKVAREKFRLFGGVLGLFQLEKWQFSLIELVPDKIRIGKTEITAGAIASDGGNYVPRPLSDAEIESRINERNEARKRKDFSRADEIRRSLAALDIIIEDKPDGTSRWKR
jgi:cysteinyl-tRNA synthetase